MLFGATERYICPVCNINKVEPGFQFCSKACSIDIHNMCLNCGNKQNGRKLNSKFCSQECRDANLAFNLIPREYRKVCKAFSEDPSCCTMADKCYYRHCSSLNALTFNLVMQISRSHESRVKEYLHDLKVEGIGFAVVDSRRISTQRPDGRVSRSSQVHLFVHAQSEGPNGVGNTRERKASQGNPDSKLAERAIGILMSDTNLVRVVNRVVAVQQRAASTEELLRETLRMLENHAAQGNAEGALSYRVMALPKSLEDTLTSEIQTKLPAYTLNSRDPGVVIGIVDTVEGSLLGSFNADRYLLDCWALRQKERETNVADSNNTDGLICRAARKIIEVFRRCPHMKPTGRGNGTGKEGWLAIDIGASPGGWSYTLANMPHCGKVISIDPGAMRQPIPANVEHIPAKVQDCTPDLLNRGIVADLVVCDMNVTPAQTTDALLDLLPVIKPGATIVLTFKNFVGNRSNMQKVKYKYAHFVNN